MSERVGENHYATERQGSSEAKARGIVAVELKRRRKGDPGKIRIAGRLRAETTMTLKWIAAELQMVGVDLCVQPAVPTPPAAKRQDAARQCQ